jgi:hypothetical protein
MKLASTHKYGPDSRTDCTEQYKGGSRGRKQKSTASSVGSLYRRFASFTSTGDAGRIDPITQRHGPPPRDWCFVPRHVDSDGDPWQ